MAFLNDESLKEIGFKSVGKNVLISERAVFYGAKNISIGSNTRIDDFVILSAGEAGISLGSYVHIGCYSSLIGQGFIQIGDFSNISSKVAIYSSNDDYSGESLTNPMVSEKFKALTIGPVTVQKHVIIGSGAVILPNVILGEGCAVGALSFVNNNCKDFFIYAGQPAVKIKPRSKKLLDLEVQFLSEKIKK